jgi:hypothetical protein
LTVTLAFARWKPAIHASCAAPCADEPAPSSVPERSLSASPCSLTAHPPSSTAAIVNVAIVGASLRARIPQS